MSRGRDVDPHAVIYGWPRGDPSAGYGDPTRFAGLLLVDRLLWGAC